MTYKVTLSVDELISAIAEHTPDVLVISAHGFSNPTQNVAGIQVGNESSAWSPPAAAVGYLERLPCRTARDRRHYDCRSSTARRGHRRAWDTGAVDVLHNAVLMQRLFVYMTEVLAGREDHRSVREVWHRVQTSNAVHDVTSGHPMFQEWFMTRPPAAVPPRTKYSRSAAQRSDSVAGTSTEIPKPACWRSPMVSASRTAFKIG